MKLRVEAAGRAVVLTIDRPETKNAIDRELAGMLGDEVRRAASDPSVRGVVIAAAGETFVSGGDLKEFSTIAGEDRGSEHVLEMFDRISIIETCDVPVIAAVQGDVFGGGCELALLCDLVIAEEQSSFAFRHAKMGLSPAWGGLTRLIERSGPMEASRLLFTAERVSAAEALRVGLINEVVAKGGALARALSRVERIAENGRATVAALKRAVREVREARRGDAMAKERAVFVQRWGRPDHLAAIDEFFAKRR